MTMSKENNGLNRPVALSNLLWLILVLILIASNIYLFWRYKVFQKQISESQNILAVEKTNEKVLEFTKLFVEKVLKSEEEVDLETRLKLETAVRDLNDQEILEQWNKFVESENEFQAQVEVKNLLGILVNKIRR